MSRPAQSDPAGSRPARGSRPVPEVGPRSRCPPIGFEHTSEPFVALHCTLHVGLVARLLDQLVVETLVIALEVVVLRVLLTAVRR